MIHNTPPPAPRRTRKRTQRQAKHLTARERRLLLLYDQALTRDAWRSPPATRKHTAQETHP